MIAYTNYFIPPDRICVSDVIEAVSPQKLPPAFATCQHGIEFFEAFLGLREVACAKNLSAAGMLERLLSTFFEERIVFPLDIKWIVVVGAQNIGTGEIPNIGHYLQHTYNIRNANVIQLSGNHCSNFEYAVAYSEGILKAFPDSNLLLVAANYMHSLEERLVGAYAVKGDGAAVAYLNNVNGNGVDILGTFAYTNGSMYEASVNDSDLVTLYKDYTVCLRGLIQRFNITPADISYVIIQNANHLLTVQTLQMLGFSEDQIYLDNIGAHGHLDCIDFVVNLQSVCRLPLPPNAKLISFGTGYAGSNIAMYLQVNQ